MTSNFDVAVVGGGLTGLTAAHHAALEGADVVHLTGSGIPGGLVSNVGELEGYPATGPISAIDLAMKMAEENRRLGVEIVTEDVSRLAVAGKLKALQAGGDTYAAKAVVAATGARLRMLEAEGVSRLMDKGVSQCAWCNGGLHRGQEVVVVGGGDSALQEALHLARFAARVTIVTRGDALRARGSLIDRAADSDRIAFRWETEVTEVLGDDRVAAVRLNDKAAGTTEVFPCQGLFVYIGLAPNSAWLGEHVDRDDSGHVVTNDALATSLRGLFAAGAVRSGYQGRLTHAVGEATTAAIAAARQAIV
ncbi:MAG: NAD(P)/FAD-dependent oxidoreductase [Hyphomicrobiaceae bacterium]